MDVIRSCRRTRCPDEVDQQDGRTRSPDRFPGTDCCAVGRARRPGPSPRAGASTTIPGPTVDEPAPVAGSSETAVLAGGCFWGVQGVFQHVKGVSQAVSGYAGGDASTAQYETVGTGTTGHAESVRITYDPGQVSFGQLSAHFLLRRPRPDRAEPAGPRRRRTVSIRDLPAERRSERGRRRLHRTAQRSEGLRLSDRDAYRYRCGLLSRRGLPPGLPELPSG